MSSLPDKNEPDLTNALLLWFDDAHRERFLSNNPQFRQRWDALVKINASPQGSESPRSQSGVSSAREIVADCPAGAAPYGYLWFNKHTEQRFTHRIPHPLSSEQPIGEVVPVYLAAPSAKKTTASDEMADSVRGILQLLRGKNGATFQDVRYHCRARGDDLDTTWPVWALAAEGYVTESAGAKLIYEVMASTDGKGQP